MKTEENKYGFAYAEVLEVIKHLSRSDIEKIPKDVLNKLMGEADEKSDFVYDEGKPFEEQGISDEAKKILAYFKVKYWSKS